MGKPFASVGNDSKRFRIQEQRIQTIRELATKIEESGAAFVLVAGDLFDSPHVTKSTVSAACSAIGSLKVPVIAIPGNHDHGGPGSIWEQEFFLREQQQLAPNFQILLKPEPLILDSAVIFPAPLLRRHNPSDPTAWIREAVLDPSLPSEIPRVVLAHGSIQGFGSQQSDEDDAPATVNWIDLSSLPSEAIDYIALGDWHGTKQVGSKAWYSGTPEIDRFPKGEGNDPGNVSEYLDSSSAVQAHYEYDAFGRENVAVGTLAANFEFRFSTKYQDVETGLYYYGYRYYDPETGRWLNRDPLGEKAFFDSQATKIYEKYSSNGLEPIGFGPVAIEEEVEDLERESTLPEYHFLLNASVNNVDRLGLDRQFTGSIHGSIFVDDWGVSNGKYVKAGSWEWEFGPDKWWKGPGSSLVPVNGNIYSTFYQSTVTKKVVPKNAKRKGKYNAGYVATTPCEDMRLRRELETMKSNNPHLYHLFGHNCNDFARYYLTWGLYNVRVSTVSTRRGTKTRRTNIRIDDKCCNPDGTPWER